MDLSISGKLAARWFSSFCSPVKSPSTGWSSFHSCALSQNMILAGRLALEKSPNDFCLSLPERQCGADEILIDFFHVCLLVRLSTRHEARALQPTSNPKEKPGFRRSPE